MRVRGNQTMDIPRSKLQVEVVQYLTSLVNSLSEYSLGFYRKVQCSHKKLRLKSGSSQVCSSAFPRQITTLI